MSIADILALISAAFVSAMTAVFWMRKTPAPAIEPLEETASTTPQVAVVAAAPAPESNRQKLYDAAKDSLGKVMKLDPAVSNLLACASSLSGVLTLAGVEGLPAKGIPSTRSLANWLRANDAFELVDTPLPGDIVMTASPIVAKPGQLEHGHVGICAAVDQGVMSNDSDTGKWMEKWNLPDWLAYYGDYGKLETIYFRYRG